MPCVVRFEIKEASNPKFSIEKEASQTFRTDLNYITGEGTSNYERLYNKPQINSVTLIGNKTSEELGLEPTIQNITEHDIDEIIYGG